MCYLWSFPQLGVVHRKLIFTIRTEAFVPACHALFNVRRYPDYLQFLVPDLYNRTTGFRPARIPVVAHCSQFSPHYLCHHWIFWWIPVQKKLSPNSKFHLLNEIIVCSLYRICHVLTVQCLAVFVVGMECFHYLFLPGCWYS